MTSRNEATSAEKELNIIRDEYEQAAQPSAKLGDSVQPPPNGGSQAWLQVFASFCMIFSTFGAIVMFGDYQAYYERGTIFTQSSSNISWIGSVQSLVFFLFGALAGPIYDRGHIKLLIATGGFLITFGHMMLSLCSQFWHTLLAQGLIIGIGGGCLFVPALSVIQPYFISRLGLALGIVGMGSSLGSIVFPIIFINAIDSVGFDWTPRILGFVSLVTFVPALAISKMRVRPLAARKIWDSSVLTDGKFMLCILGVFLGYAGTQVSFFYIAYFGQANGWFIGNVALYLQPIMSATSTVGRVIPNVIADKIGPINVVIPGSIIIGIITLCNLAVGSAAGVICTALFFGVASGVFVSLPPLLFMSLTEDKSKLGARMGIGYAFMGLSVFLAGPPTGAILQHDPAQLDWNAAWTYAGVLSMAACPVFCVLRAWQGGLKVSSKV